MSTSTLPAGCRPGRPRCRGRPRGRRGESRRWRRPRRSAGPRRAACRPRWRRRRAVAGPCFRAVGDRGGVTLTDEMLAHPASHDAGADPADARLARFCLAAGHEVFPSAQRRDGCDAAIVAAEAARGKHTNPQQQQGEEGVPALARFGLQFPCWRVGLQSSRRGEHREEDRRRPPSTR